jgi:acetolactate synthase-1/2/3 large subunit
MATTVADRLVATLEDLGVELVFGLPGVHNLAIWKAISGSSIRLVSVRHEQAAVYAADGYARASGNVGVALVTTGPGAANTLGATGEAMASSSPVVVIATDIPSTLRRDGVYRGVLHETRDQAAMFEPVTKAATTVAPGDPIGRCVAEAVQLASAANTGPVYLGIPTDLLTQEASSAPAPPPPAEVRPAPDAALLERACDMLSKADVPLIWAGGGALRSGAGEQVGLVAELLAAPVITTYMSRGLLAPEHPFLAPGPVHAPPIGALWDDADVVLAVGTDFDGMMTQNWLLPRPKALISVNVDEADANKNYRSDITLVGDARRVLESMLRRLDPVSRQHDVRDTLESIAREVSDYVLADDPQAARMLEIFDRALPPDTVVLADMCIPGYWLAGFRRVPAPRKLAYPVGWGTLGFAFPASIGAALADAGPTVCVTGDGGFLFALGELATVAQEQIPVVVVLVDDSGYGMLRFDQIHAGDEPFGVDLVRPDFVALAGSFGVPASRVNGFGEEFEGELVRSVRAGEPHVLVVSAALKPPPTTSPRWYRRQSI